MQAVYVTTFQIHIRYTAGRGLLPLLKKGNCKDVIVHELQRVYNRSFDDSLNKNYINRSASLYLVTRTLSQRLSVSLAWRLDREMRRGLILHEAEFTS